MTPFEILEPTSLDEALSLLDPDDPDVRPFSGGTALMLLMKAGVFRPQRLVSLRKVGEGLTGIATTSDGGLRIGAMTPLAVLERSDLVRDRAPVVTQTLRTLSNIRVRNVATVGGHLGHADPHMDLPPVLAALGAAVTVVGRGGERILPVADLATGYMETALAPDELISALTIPAPAGTAAYVKCTTRSADDWPALGVAVAFSMQGGQVRDARIVISAATERPTRLTAAEAALEGSGADDDALRRMGDAAADEAEVTSDVFGSADYKKQLVRVHVGRAARQALAAAQGGRG